MLLAGESAASTRGSPNSALSDSASAALSAAVRAEGSAPGSFFSISTVPARIAFSSSSSSQRRLRASSSEGGSAGSGDLAATSSLPMSDSAPSSRSLRAQPVTAGPVTPASAARSAARSPAS